MYLGFPLTLRSSPPSLWLDVLAKLKVKIIYWGGLWLSMVGKLILVKVVLSTFPIFQSALLLAPKSILAQISKIMRDFLWLGGKGNHNKMHLVSWEVLKRPFSEGGLQIRDPRMTNLALSGKLIWQLFEDKHHLVSHIFRMKYLRGAPLRSISSANTPPGTTIWNSCRKSFGFFTQQLFRIPGNGKSTLL